MDAIKNLVLCGPTGPSGVSTLVFGHVQGVYYALQGDGASAAAAGAGVWGSLSGSVLGFVVGGPIGAFIGGLVGGSAASLGTKALINSQGSRLDYLVLKYFLIYCLRLVLLFL